MRSKNSSYQNKLLLFLCVATFFDGFDFMAISQILPNLRNEMGLSQAQGGIMMAFINLGAIAGYFLLRATDRLGRRKLLNVTIIGYTISTFLSGFAYDGFTFGLMQFFARMFLIAEAAIAMVFIAEEFPAHKRGLAMGIVQGSLSLGMVSCAAVVPLLLKLPMGWRSVFLIGIVPLILIAFARRSILETQRFDSVDSTLKKKATSFFAIWNTPYRKRILQLGLIWFFTYLCVQSAVLFWKEFAVGERSFTDSQVGMAISLASLISMPFVFATGKLLDIVGRKWGSLIIFGIEIFAVWASYSLNGFWPLTSALVLGVFGASAVMIVLNTYTTELFPTHFRGSAFAWSNNLLGRIGYVSSPLLVGVMAESWGWGFSMKATLLSLCIALVLILIFLPETKGKELEETSQV